LGVIVEVTLDCVPSFTARRTSEEWAEDVVEGVRDFPMWRPERKIKQWYWYAGSPGHRRRGGMRRASTEVCTDVQADCKPWWQAFGKVHNGLLYSWKVNEMEMSVDVSLAPDVIAAFRTFVQQHVESLDPTRIGWHILGRYVARDDAWLSPSYGRDSVFITFYTICKDTSKPRTKYCEGKLASEGFCRYGEVVPCNSPFLTKQMEVFGREWERVAYSVGKARPHWGKLNHANATYLATVYPKHQEFVRIARELDPHGMFLNDYLIQRLLKSP